MRAALGLCVVFALSGCVFLGDDDNSGDDDDDDACTAGEVDACTCGSGASGLRQCQDNGTFGGCVCTSPQVDAAPDDIDSGPFVCNNDMALEPNNDIGNATPTGIPETQSTFNLATLAICPDSDVDVYRMASNVTGQNIQVSLRTDRAIGDLILEILNGTGVVVATGTYVDDENMTVSLTNAPVGTWFVQVRSAGTQNNYTAFSIAVTGP